MTSLIRSPFCSSRISASWAGVIHSRIRERCSVSAATRAALGPSVGRGLVCSMSCSRRRAIAVSTSWDMSA
ncbi:hypothetical protein [Streptomyces sp. WM6372]|uniref:hypothetical protein n=1 Tax=Streptomyces sp. WM6372 TaxID=1415555 RepID=UPI001F26A8EB|nr:hypothetical protein [Streptomyces sp. WM6372]